MASKKGIEIDRVDSLENNRDKLVETEEENNKYHIHRNLETVNKLDSASGTPCSPGASGTSLGPQVSRVAKNDGMGTLSQEQLEEGDPIEKKRTEAAIEKVAPSTKGYQRGTQKSENIRLRNDKKL